MDACTCCGSFSFSGSGASCCRHLGVLEVDDSAVVSEQIHLLDPGDVVHTQSLQCVLKSLVVCLPSVSLASST
eukprot:751720-Hanusia_phi.AAC.1